MAYTWIADWNDAPRWPELGLSGLGLVRTLKPGDVQRAADTKRAQQNAALGKGRRRPAKGGGEIGQPEEGAWPAPQTGKGQGPCPSGTVPYQGTCAPTQTGSGGGVTHSPDATTTSAGGGVTQGPDPYATGGGLIQGPAPSGGPRDGMRSDGAGRLGPGGGSALQQNYLPPPPIPVMNTGGATPAPPLPPPPPPFMGGSGSGSPSPYAMLGPRPANPFATSAGSPSRRYPNGTTPRGAYLFPDMRLARIAYEAQAAAQQPQTIVHQSMVQAAAAPAPGVASPYASPGGGGGGGLPQPLLTTPTAASQAQEAGIETLRALSRGQELGPASPSGPGAFWVVAGILVAGGLVWAATRT